MNLNLSIPQNIENVQPKISVIGVGGAGCNAVNTMINSKVNNINFLVANTDGQALSRSMTKTQIQYQSKNKRVGRWECALFHEGLGRKMLIFHDFCVVCVFVEGLG